MLASQTCSITAMYSPAVSENFLSDVNTELEDSLDKMATEGAIDDVESVASATDSTLSTSAGSADLNPYRKLKVLDAGKVHEKNDHLLSLALDQAGTALCYQCGEQCDVSRTIVKVKTTLGNTDKFACRKCNALTVMLCRNMTWPPMFFSELDPASQKQFFKSCHETTSESGRFSYSKVRCTLVKSLTNSKKVECSAEAYTEPHPLKYWIDQGYEEERIKANATKVEHSCGTLYQFPIIRTSQKVSIEQVESHVQQCEQKVTANKKRALEDDEDSSDSDVTAGSSSSSKKGKKGKKGKTGTKDKGKRKADREKAAKKKEADDKKKAKHDKDKADKSAKKAADKADATEAARIKKHNGTQASTVRKIIALLKAPHDSLAMACLVVASADHADKVPPNLRDNLTNAKDKLTPMMSEATGNQVDVDRCVKNKTEAPTLSFSLETAQTEVKVTVEALKSFRQLSSAMNLPALS